MSSRPTRILVIRFSSIGDIVLTAPAIASLRAAIHGPCEVHFLTKSSMQSVAEGFGPLVDHIHTIDSSTAEVTQVLKSTGIDYIVDLHSNVRSRSIKKALGCIAFTLKKENFAKWLLVRGWRNKPVAHIVERYIDAFRDAFGAQTPEEWPELFAHTGLPLSFEAHAGDWEILAVGAAHAGKQMPYELMESIIQHVQSKGHRIVLIGGLADAPMGSKLQKNAGKGALNLVGKTSLSESAALIRGARHCYAGDTGMMHLSAALGTSISSFWGCTRPSLGMSPWLASSGSHMFLPENRSSIQPCSKLGNRCRHRGESLCIQQHGFTGDT